MSFHNVCKKVLWCLSHIKTRCNLCCYTCEMAVIYFLPHNLSARNKLDVFPNELFHLNIQDLSTTVTFGVTHTVRRSHSGTIDVLCYNSRVNQTSFMWPKSTPNLIFFTYTSKVLYLIVDQGAAKLQTLKVCSDQEHWPP